MLASVLGKVFQYSEAQLSSAGHFMTEMQTCERPQYSVRQTYLDSPHMLKGRPVVTVANRNACRQEACVCAGGHKCEPRAHADECSSCSLGPENRTHALPFFPSDLPEQRIPVSPGPFHRCGTIVTSVKGRNGGRGMSRA